MNPLYLHGEGYELEETLINIEIDENMPSDEIHVLDTEGNISRIVKVNLDS